MKKKLNLNEIAVIALLLISFQSNAQIIGSLEVVEFKNQWGWEYWASGWVLDKSAPVEAGIEPSCNLRWTIDDVFNPAFILNAADNRPDLVGAVVDGYTIINGQHGFSEVVFNLPDKTIDHILKVYGIEYWSNPEQQTLIGEYLIPAVTTDINNSEDKEIQISLSNNIVSINSYSTVNKILVLNMQGKMVFQFSNQEKSFDLNMLPKGVYIINIHTNGKNIQEKIVLI